MCFNKHRKKSLTITKNKIEKIKRQVYIKLFNLAKRDVYLVLLTEFVY
jgi:hypothetical protein